MTTNRLKTGVEPNHETSGIWNVSHTIDSRRYKDLHIILFILYNVT